MSSQQVPLYRRDGSVRAYAQVDESDYPAVANYRWHVGGNSNYRYAVRSGDHGPVLMHRQILDCRGGKEADHVNGDGLDNRRANLRVVTHAQNMQNRKPHRHGRSPYRGVSWHSGKQKWRAEIDVAGRTKHLGWFHSDEDAGEVARQARRRFMPFAVDRCVPG